MTHPLRKRSSVSNLIEHIVFTPKYRGKVLRDNVVIECERIIRFWCHQHDIRIIQLAIEPEHLHILIQRPPSLSTSRAVEIIKTKTSRELRQLFPHLVKWCPKALWSRGFHAVSVGHGREAVIQHIRAQGQGHTLSKSIGSIGQLPNAVGLMDDTSKMEGSNAK